MENQMNADEKDQLKKQLLKTIRHHKNEIMKRASQDAVASPDATVPGLFFITDTFIPLKTPDNNEPLFRQKESYLIGDPTKLLESAHQNHNLFYKHILNQTVPSNHFPQRKKHYPIALSFFDFSGTKNHRPLLHKIPHAHSFFIVPPKTLPRFQSLIADRFRIAPNTPKTQNIMTVDCQEMIWDWREIAETLDYAAKTYLNYTDHLPKETQSLFFTIHG
jgi:hypothetical protein